MCNRLIKTKEKTKIYEYGAIPKLNEFTVQCRLRISYICIVFPFYDAIVHTSFHQIENHRY